MDQILAEARAVKARLEAQDSAAELLLTKCSQVRHKLAALQQCENGFEELNVASGRRSKSELLHGSQHESQRIQTLEEENVFLQKSLEDHEEALELVMKKYREQITDLIAVNRIDNLYLTLVNQGEETETKRDEISEMATVMKKAIELDENSSELEQQLIAALRYENEGLRDLLGISSVDLVDREADEDTDQSSDFSSYKLQHIPPDVTKESDETKEKATTDGTDNDFKSF